MEEFDPPRRWRWVGPFLSVRVHYDHWFADANGHTPLMWIVDAEGPSAGTVGRIFGERSTRAISTRRSRTSKPNFVPGGSPRWHWIGARPAGTRGALGTASRPSVIRRRPARR